MDYLYVCCPAVDCPNPDKSLRYWYHGNGCGSRTMLRYSDIHIICSGCYQSAVMFDWNFKCSAHNYRESSKQGWLYALSLLGQQKGNSEQIAQAIKQIAKYC